MTWFSCAFRIGGIAWLIVLFAFNAWPSPAPEGQPSDPEQLLSVVRSFFEQRAKAVASSRGRVRLELELTRPPEAEKALREGISKDLGLDPSKLRTSGVAEWSVDWWKKENKNRYDFVPDDRGARRDLGVPENMRAAVDAEKSIYYDLIGNRAYINIPPLKAAPPLSMSQHFDPEFLYEFHGRNVPEQAESYLLGESNFETDGVTTTIIDDTNCVGLIFRAEHPRKDGVVLKNEVSFWFAPEMAYSLVKAERKAVFVSGNEVTDAYHELYEAKYAASEDKPGFWLIKELYVSMKEFGRREEKLKVKVEKVHVGVEISDETFTFAGMGVPEGVYLFDKRLGGQPILTRYSSDMNLGLATSHVNISRGAAPPTSTEKTLPAAVPPATATSSTTSRFKYLLCIPLVMAIIVFFAFQLKRHSSGN